MLNGDSDGRALYRSISLRLQAPVAADSVGALAADTVALCTTWRHLFAQAAGGPSRVAATVLSKIRRDVPAAASAAAKELAQVPPDASSGHALLLVELLQVAAMGQHAALDHRLEEIDLLSRHLARCLASLQPSDDVAAYSTRAVLVILSCLRAPWNDMLSLQKRWAVCERCWATLAPYLPRTWSEAFQVAAVDGIWGAARTALAAAWEATAPARHAAAAWASSLEHQGASPAELLQRDQRSGYTTPLDSAWGATVFAPPVLPEVPSAAWACASGAMRLLADDQSYFPIRTPDARTRRREMLLALQPSIVSCVRVATICGAFSPAADRTARWGLWLELQLAQTCDSWALAAARFRLLEALGRHNASENTSESPEPLPSLGSCPRPNTEPLVEMLLSDATSPWQLITAAVSSHVRATAISDDDSTPKSPIRGAAAWLPLCLVALAILRRSATACPAPDERLGVVCCVLCRSVALKGTQASSFSLPSDPLIIGAFCVVAGAAVEAAIGAGDLLAARRLMFLPVTVVTAALVPSLLQYAQSVANLWHSRSLPAFLCPPIPPHSRSRPHRVWYEPQGTLPLDPGVLYERCRVLAFGPPSTRGQAAVASRPSLLARTVAVYLAPAETDTDEKIANELRVLQYDAEGGCTVAAAPWTDALCEAFASLRGAVAAAAQHAAVAIASGASVSANDADSKRAWWDQRLRYDVALGVALRKIEVALGPALFLLPGRAPCDAEGRPSMDVWKAWTRSCGLSVVSGPNPPYSPMLPALVHALRSIPDVVSAWRREPDVADPTVDGIEAAALAAAGAILPLLQAVVPGASCRCAASLVAAALDAWPVPATAPTTSFATKFAPRAAAAPWVIVTDEAARVVPWEHTCVARPAMCTRSPSLAHAARMAAATVSSTVVLTVASDGRYCTVDPTGQLAKTRERLGPVLRAQGWAGTVGCATVDGTPAMPLREWGEQPGFDRAAIVLYAGHNDPELLLGRSTLLRLAQEAAYMAAGRTGEWGNTADAAAARKKCILALGCSSAAPREAALLAGDTLACTADVALCYGVAESYIGFAWDGTDGEFDRVAVATLQLTEQERHDRYCSALLRCARGSCKLKRLTGAAVVAYGRCDSSA